MSEKNLRLIRFSITLYLIIVMSVITFVNLAIAHEQEKQKRYEFLVENKIIFESKLVEDILAMLVPKFIKNAMMKGKFLFHLIFK